MSGRGRVCCLKTEKTKENFCFNMRNTSRSVGRCGGGQTSLAAVSSRCGGKRERSAWKRRWRNPRRNKMRWRRSRSRSRRRRNAMSWTRRAWRNNARSVNKGRQAASDSRRSVGRRRAYLGQRFWAAATRRLLLLSAVAASSATTPGLFAPFRRRPIQCCRPSRAHVLVVPVAHVPFIRYGQRCAAAAG